MRQVVLSAASGLLLAASFPRLAAYPLVFVALVPLSLAVSEASAARRFALGWVAGASFHLIAWRWALPTIAYLQEFSLPAAVPFFALFVGYQSLQIALFALFAFAGRFHAAPFAGPLVAASAWVVLEWAFPRIIPCYLADPLAASPVLRQAADLGGVYGLSFVVALVNASAAAVLFPSLLPRSKRLRLLIVPTAVLTATAAYGITRDAHPSSGDPSRTAQVSPKTAPVQVTVVQANQGAAGDDRGAANEAAWQAYELLTQIGLPGAPAAGTSDRKAPEQWLIVWPETVLRVYLDEDSIYRQRVSDLVESLNTPLLLGALQRAGDGPDERNSAFLFSPRALASQEDGPAVYSKQRLIAFGESVPVGIAGRLGWRTTGNFVPGDSVQSGNLQLPGAGSATSFAPSICFEAIFSGAFNAAVRSGAGFLVNVTDDGWFGDTDEPYQHLNATVLRAVETRRWLVRASNSGISALVDPSGAVMASIPLRRTGVLTHLVEPATTLTPYVRLGDWPVGFALLIIAASVRRSGWRSPANRRPT